MLGLNKLVNCNLLIEGATYCRSVINVEMRLLDALAMIPLRIRKAKKTFLQEVTVIY